MPWRVIDPRLKSIGARILPSMLLVWASWTKGPGWSVYGSFCRPCIFGPVVASFVGAALGSSVNPCLHRRGEAKKSGRRVRPPRMMWENLVNGGYKMGSFRLTSAVRLERL